MSHDYAIFTSKTVIVQVGLHYHVAAAWSSVALYLLSCVDDLVYYIFTGVFPFARMYGAQVIKAGR